MCTQIAKNCNFPRAACGDTKISLKECKNSKNLLCRTEHISIGKKSLFSILLRKLCFDNAILSLEILILSHWMSKVQRHKIQCEKQWRNRRGQGLSGVQSQTWQNRRPQVKWLMSLSSAWSSSCGPTHANGEKLKKRRRKRRETPYEATLRIVFSLQYSTPKYLGAIIHDFLSPFFDFWSNIPIESHSWSFNINP